MITEPELIADLKAAYPKLFVRPLAEFGAQGWTEGVWTGGEALMPDGLPIFTGIHNDCDEYDGFVHAGFAAWLESRGWYIEPYDAGTFFIVSAESAVAL